MNMSANMNLIGGSEESLAVYTDLIWHFSVICVQPDITVWHYPISPKYQHRNSQLVAISFWTSFFPNWEILYHFPVDSLMYILKTAAVMGFDIRTCLLVGWFSNSLRHWLHQTYSVEKYQEYVPREKKNQPDLILAKGDPYFNPIKTSRLNHYAVWDNYPMVL